MRDEEAIDFCEDLIELFHDACRKNKKIKNYLYQGKKRYYSRLKKNCEKKQKNKEAEAFRERLLDTKREYNRLFTFMDHPGVESSNNQAEQSLKNFVILRKICFGTRSSEGSHSHSVLPSLLLTAKRQGIHPLSFFLIFFPRIRLDPRHLYITTLRRRFSFDL